MDVLAELDGWLRPYQKRFLRDPSRYRVVVKSRQIGMTRVMALDIVLTCSGLHPHAHCHNYTIISKDENAAKDVIQDCLDWVNILAKDERFRDAVELITERTTKLRFKRSRREIVSQAQSRKAGVGKRGHLLLDEYAKYYEHQASIWRYATPSVRSNPNLRMTMISTPDGAGDHFYEVVHDRKRWSHWNLHSIDLVQAIEDGMPVTVEECRRDCNTDADYEQEYMCSFLVPGDQYMSRTLFESCQVPRLTGKVSRVVAGIDVASENDMTAVVIMQMVGRVGYISHVYIIQGIPYGSDDDRGIVGQDRVLAALIRKHKPDTTVMDATGDGGEVFGYLIAENPPTRIIGHTFTRQWKLDVVPKIRGAMERGLLRISSQNELVYQPKVGHRYTTDGRVVDLEAFTSRGFGVSTFPILRSDFMKVHRRLTPVGPTYDTHRSGGSHGDAFWASAMAFAATIMPINAPVRPRDPDRYEVEHGALASDYL
jgi:phage FluMu gp28-like protein